jgi:hypothetical protein
LRFKCVGLSGSPSTQLVIEESVAITVGLLTGHSE